MKPPALPSTPKGRERLLKLADILKADAKNKSGVEFDMNTWGEGAKKKLSMSCGTRACAMGVAALSGKFRGLKARTVWNEYDSEDYRTGKPIKVIEGSLAFCWDGGDNVDGCLVAEQLFELTEKEADYLFTMPSGRGAIGEYKMAKLLRRFVAGKDVGIEYDPDPSL